MGTLAQRHQELRVSSLLMETHFQSKVYVSLTFSHLNFQTQGPQPTQRGGTIKACLPIHQKDLSSQPTQQPVIVLNTNPTVHPQETHHRKQQLSKTDKEDKSCSTSNCTETQFSTLDIVPNGQMDGKREEGQEGKLARSSASSSHHPHLVFITSGLHLSGYRLKEELLLNVIFDLWSSSDKKLFHLKTFYRLTIDSSEYFTVCFKSLNLAGFYHSLLSNLHRDYH